MLIEIRPIETLKWHGKTGEESFAVPKKIQALVDGKTRKYATGLSDEEKKKLEEELNVDLSDNYSPDAPHPFWDSNNAILRLPNSTIFLDKELPIELIKLRMAQASRFVANSMKDYEDGKFPEATHVIFNEAEENELKASKVEIRNKAIMESSKLSKDKKVEIILILKGKNLKGQSDNFVLVEMNNLIDDRANDVLRWIQNEDATFVTNYALVIECLQKGILVRDGHKIMHYDANLGGDEITVAEYLGQDENQELRLRLMQQVNT